MAISQGSPQATLDCIANARPLHELRTFWYKDGVPIENAGVSYSLVNDFWNRSLTLVSVNTTHKGEYECQVSLVSGGFPTVKASAIVTVLQKPRFLGTTKTDSYTESYGSLVSLPCDVYGVPKPNITWYKNSREMDLSDSRYLIIMFFFC